MDFNELLVAATGHSVTKHSADSGHWMTVEKNRKNKLSVVLMCLLEWERGGGSSKRKVGGDEEGSWVNAEGLSEVPKCSVTGRTGQAAGGKARRAFKKRSLGYRTEDWPQLDTLKFHFSHISLIKTCIRYLILNIKILIATKIGQSKMSVNKLCFKSMWTFSVYRPRCDTSMQMFSRYKYSFASLDILVEIKSVKIFPICSLTAFCHIF